MIRRIWLALPVLILSTPFAMAHSGGLDANGCHNQSSTGQYHCHRAQAPQSPSNGFSFRNCTAARAAGYSNIRAGTYGYGLHLDRDRDGIGCES